jgi:hypothetical protein
VNAIREDAAKDELSHLYGMALAHSIRNGVIAARSSPVERHHLWCLNSAEAANVSVAVSGPAVGVAILMTRSVRLALSRSAAEVKAVIAVQGRQVGF